MIFKWVARYFKATKQRAGIRAQDIAGTYTRPVFPLAQAWAETKDSL